MTLVGQRTIDCHACGGSGKMILLKPDCCGRVHELGYCRGDCAVPREEEVWCETCDGGGKVPLPDGGGGSGSNGSEG